MITTLRNVCGALTIRALCVCVLAAITGCKTPEVQPFKVRIRVEGDPKEMLADVPVILEGKEAGRSDKLGNIDIAFGRPDGVSVQLMVKCPGDRRLADPISVRIIRTADDKPIEFAASCKPVYRTVVVAVRAENGANLPVMHLSDVRAHTDASGAAHFALSVRPGESIPIRIDTSKNDKLRPQNPVQNFIVGDADEVVLVNQKFQIDRPVVVYHGHRHGPVEVVIPK